MLPASNRGAGMNLGFPDVCLTPAVPSPIPVPYPNIAMHAQAVGFSMVVKVSGVNALNLGTKIAMTSGDEAGTAHPMIKQVGAFTMGNSIVSIDQMPAINLTCPTTGNNMNNPIGAVLVPGAVNVLYTFATTAHPGDEPMSAEAVRDLVGSLHDVPPLGAATWLPGGVALLPIARFTADLPARVHDAVRDLTGRGARALVLDLRGNPGGELDACVRLAGDFLPAGAEITRVTDADGDVVVHRAGGGRPCALPLVLLVDGGTASAAEIFAAALQAHQRAVVVGTRTYGKGRAQAMAAAVDGEGVRYVHAARCARIDGAPIDGIGVTPDLDVASAPTRDLTTDAAALAALRIALELLSAP